MPTFDSNSITGKPLSYERDGFVGTSPEVNAAAELYYNITGLTMGRQYYVRVTGHHSLGMGANSEVRTVKPYEWSTAPLDVKLSLRSGVSPFEYGTGLRVTFSPPASDGGDPITKYRVEYSTDDFQYIYARNPTFKGFGPRWLLSFDLRHVCVLYLHGQSHIHDGEDTMDCISTTSENSIKEFAKHGRR